ncbi:MAG: type II toxin-antitoxin system HicB family antitoxin [Terriglobia bacterium]
MSYDKKDEESIVMKSNVNQFEFTGAIFKEGRWFVSLCLDVDIASQGKTLRQAKEMLAEAVSLYLEVCLESNLPYLRPVPREQDPRFQPRKNLVEVFPVRVSEALLGGAAISQACHSERSEESLISSWTKTKRDSSLRSE